MVTEQKPSYVHIAWTRYSMIQMPVLWCWKCRQRRRVLARHQAYYGWDMTCLTCAAEWADGERKWLSRSAKTRRRIIDAAKAYWAAYNTPEGRAPVKAAYDAEMKAMMESRREYLEEFWHDHYRFEGAPHG